MGRYITRRLLQAIPLLLLLSVFMFTLVHLLPGGPEAVLISPRMTAATRAALRVRFGLNDPVVIQYVKWLGRVFTGDFGFSLQTFQPVTSTIGAHLMPTVELFCISFALALVVAIIMGMLSGIRQGTVTDYTLTTLSYFGISMPVFLFGILAQDIFAVKLHLLPVSGTATPGVTYDAFNALWDHALHLLLPMLVLSITFVAGWSRYVRASMIEVTSQDYMRTARAKGVSASRLLLRHALRNALIPLITIVALDFGQIAGGAAVTEGIFTWPGMGSLFLDSLDARDFPVLLAMLLLAGVCVVLFNLLADVLYAVADPRIRYS